MESRVLVDEIVHLNQAAWLEEVPERTRYREPSFGRRQAADPVRVFVIDADVTRSARLLAQVHAIGSFDTRRAGGCDSALRLADDFLPNIVLLNVDCPDLGSFRLASSLRWRAGLIGVRLIALTTDVVAVDRFRALEAGFEQYLTIPTQHATLERVLRQPVQLDGPLTDRRISRRHH